MKDAWLWVDCLGPDQMATDWIWRSLERMALDLLLAALPFLVGQLHGVDHVVEIPDDAFQVLLDLLHVFDQ